MSIITSHGIKLTFSPEWAKEENLIPFSYQRKNTTQSPHTKTGVVYCEDHLCFETLLSYWNAEDNKSGWYYTEVVQTEN